MVTVGSTRWRPPSPGGSRRTVAPLDALVGRTEQVLDTTGQSQDDAAAVVVEELERAAAALTARIAPLVPGCGVLVAASGLLFKTEPGSDPVADTFAAMAVLFAVAGFGFLVRAVFIDAGRKIIGLPPTVDDIAFARGRLIRKHNSALRGGLLAGTAFACLLLGTLTGVHISVG